MSREGNRADESTTFDGFPWLVAMASLAVGLWIFFSSTVDACREREQLQRAEERLIERGEGLLDATIRLRQRRRDLPESGDLLMVELDRHGMLPHEAIERWGTGSAEPRDAR